LVSTLIAAGGGMAHAADTSETATNTLAPIVVTAQKRVEDSQKVPISLQVLTEGKLEEHQVNSFDDYAKLLTSLSFQSLGPGEAQLYFRGIASGQDGLHAGSLPATGVYLDEIPVTTIANTLDVHIYDIARIEALAGPQGTLFGASSLSGTLRIITNKPDTKAFSGGYDVKADKFGKGDGGGEFEGYVNVPLTDYAAVRLVGFYEHDGGYVNNVYTSDTFLRGAPAAGIPNDPITLNNAAFVKPRFNDVDTYGGRGALKVDLNDNWTLTPQVLFQHQLANGNSSFDPQNGDLNVTDFAPDIDQDNWYQSALAIEGKVANFDVLYSGGWFERSLHNIVDYTGYSVAYDAVAQLPGATTNYIRYVDCPPGTGTPKGNCAGGTVTNPVQYADSHDQYTKMSHEFRVTSPSDYRLRGVAGVFYQRQTDDIRSAFQVNDLPTYYSIQGSPDTIFLTQQTRVDRDYAVFTDMTFDITPQLKISGGIREFGVENTLYGFYGYNGYNGSDSSVLACNPPLSAATVIPNLVPCINTNKKVIEHGETHRLNLTYQIDPDVMLYGTYSTGFRPGGNNRAATIAPYGPDTLTNFESGWKTDWFDHRLRFNGAVFFERWNAVQLSVVGVNQITSIVNVGNATSKGIESEVDWLPIDSLTLSASGTYVNARTTQEFCNVDPRTELITHDCADPTAAAGTPLPVTPKLKVNGTARYKFNVGNYQSFFQGSVIHQSGANSQLSTVLNDEMGDLPHFTTFDFSTGTGFNNWTVQAYIENAFDKRGQLDRINECGPTSCYENYRVLPIKPMNFGVKFGERF
jgi:outer membrane receptor protein involved in Fe transport